MNLKLILFKKDNSKNVENYSENYYGISVLSPLAKIFERILCDNIYCYFQRNNCLCPNQHGLRNNFSDEKAVQTILDDWKNLLEHNKFFLSLFIDF